MALHYGFFDSATGDVREYIADDYAQRFSTFFTDGVKDGEFAVSAGTGLDIDIAVGYANIKGYHLYNDSILNVAVSSNSSGLPRIDRVILRLDLAQRIIEIDIIEGTPASSPAVPALTRTSTIHELGLAQIRINNGASTVTVTDERSNGDVCGYIGIDMDVPISEMWDDFNALIADMQEDFQDWFDSQYVKVSPSFYFVDTEPAEAVTGDIWVQLEEIS